MQRFVIFCCAMLLSSRWLGVIPAITADTNFVASNDCAVLSLFDFSGSDGADAFGHMAAAQLATEHFNSRNPVVVTHLSELALGDCTVTLPDAWFRDSRSDAIASLSAYEELHFHQDEDICAIIGLQDERSLQVLSGAAQLAQIPLVVNAPRTIQNDFASVVSSRFPMRYVARAVADYMKYLNPPREFMITLYDNEDFDGPFQERAEDEHDYHVSGEWIVSVGEDDSIQDAIEEILEEGYNTVLIDTRDPSLLEQVAEAAYENGLFDRPILWVIGSAALQSSVLREMEFEVDSPMDLLLRGAAMHADYDPFILDGARDDAFVQSWFQQNVTLVDKITSLHPLPANDPSYFAGEADYFQTNHPPTYSSFIYDSIILTGVSACQLQDKQRRNATDHPQGFVEGGDHLREMLLAKFDGASGNFAFGTEESEESESDEDERQLDEEQDDEEALDKNRSPDGFQLGIYNIRSESAGNGSNRYYAVLTARYNDSEWRELNDESFIYFDGTPNPPVPTRLTFDFHYLDQNYFIAGMVMMSVALAIIMGTAIWLVWNRNERIVSAAQPAFLYLLCFGSAMVAASLAFLSFDESFGYSDQTLSAFCMAFPWFFAIGYVIQYCALAGKLWRINKLVSNPLRRQKVRVVQALWPFGILLGCIVTLTCWQLVDPFIWVRVEIAEEPLETLGKCSSDDPVPYVATLGALIGIATMLALYVSWKAKHVQKELSESKWIFAGIFSHVQMWAIGIPVYIILNDESASSSYVIKVALTFLFSTSMVILVIWPKIYALHFHNESARPNVRVNISDTSKHVRVSGISTRILESSKHGSNTRGANELTESCRSRGKNISSAQSRNSQEASTDGDDQLTKEELDVMKDLP